MTEKPNSVCKWCEEPESNHHHGVCSIPVHMTFEPVAEPASTGEPPSCPSCRASVPGFCTLVTGTEHIHNGPESECCKNRYHAAAHLSKPSVAEPAEPPQPWPEPICKCSLRKSARVHDMKENGEPEMGCHKFEPAEPSASSEGPIKMSFVKGANSGATAHTTWAVPQPVAGEGPGAWRKFPVGHWFFLDSPICTNRYSVQERTDSGCTLVCSTPWHHDGAKTDMQRIADSHNSLAEGTPKLEAIAEKIIRGMESDEMPLRYPEIKAWLMAILRPFITPATSIRPMRFVNGSVEYGQYPAPIQAYLDELLALGKEIVERHKSWATPAELRTKEEM